MTDDLARIEGALGAAREVLRPLSAERLPVDRKERDDPVTAADRAVDRILRDLLPGPGEGWLSEETADDPARLHCRRVWVVDPLDGTREFVDGIPEWCVSVALVEDGRPVAGGICNPATDELFLGRVGDGVTLNGHPVGIGSRATLSGARVLASRTEVGRGEWEGSAPHGCTVVPMGSVAYKMARVAAGLADATWTLVPKHEWDVAAGVALVEAAGGRTVTPNGEEPSFNRPHPWLPGLVAANRDLVEAILAWT